MIVFALLALWAMVIAWFDWRQRRVPNVALVLVLVPTVLSLAIDGQSLLGERWPASLAGMAIGFALTLPGYALRRFGAGDVKFAAVLGLLLGSVRSIEMLLAASLLMGATAIAMLAMRQTRRSKFPAAPMLAAAFIAEMLAGPWLPVWSQAR